MSGLTLRPVATRAAILFASLAIAVTGLVYVEQSSASGAPTTTQTVSGTSGGASTSGATAKGDKKTTCPATKPPKVNQPPQPCKPSKG